MSTYSRVLFPVVAAAIPQPEENALLAQERVDWLASPATKVMVRGLTMEMNELRQKATALAVNYAQHQNHLQIIQLLQHADNIQQIIDKYARHKSNQ